jgi:hypothetical protein
MSLINRVTLAYLAKVIDGKDDALVNTFSECRSELNHFGELFNRLWILSFFVLRTRICTSRARNVPPIDRA